MENPYFCDFCSSRNTLTFRQAHGFPIWQTNGQQKPVAGRPYRCLHEKQGAERMIRGYQKAQIELSRPGVKSAAINLEYSASISDNSMALGSDSGSGSNSSRNFGETLYWI